MIVKHQLFFISLYHVCATEIPYDTSCWKSNLSLIYALQISLMEGDQGYLDNSRWEYPEHITDNIVSPFLSVLTRFKYTSYPYRDHYYLDTYSVTKAKSMHFMQYIYILMPNTFFHKLRPFFLESIIRSFIK
jgi:hypothetical protein